ncbi:MAG: hypothetical protein WDM79_12565 [Terricaulis sp.]
MSPYSNFSFPAFDHFLVWLSTTDLRLWLYRFEDADRFFVFLHIAAAAILFGAILLVDLRLMGFARRVVLKELAALALPWAIGGGVVAMATGLVLLMFDPIAVGVHTFFLPKMALIVLGLINALAFHRFVRLDAAETPARSTRFAGALSLVLWTGVFLCATLNATERISSSASAER